METIEKITSQSKIQLTEAYDISLRTLTSWIEPYKDIIGDYRGKAFTPKQVRIIYDLLGRP